MDVRAARIGELRPCGGIGVVPAEGRRGRVRGVLDERPRPVVRAFLRKLEDPIARPVGHRIRRDQARSARLCGAGPRQRAGEVIEVVVGRPVVCGKQCSRLRVDGRIPEVFAGRMVDHELPRFPQTAARGLPAQAKRDRRVGDPTVRNDGLGPAAADHVQVGRPAELELFGCGLDRLGRLQVGGARRCAAQFRDEATSRKDDTAVEGDIHGHVSPEHLEALVVLVEVDVGDSVVGAAIPARHDQVLDICACDAELRRVLVDVRQSDVECVDVALRRQRARCGGEEQGDEHQARPQGLVRHVLPPRSSATAPPAVGLLSTPRRPADGGEDVRSAAQRQPTSESLGPARARPSANGRAGPRAARSRPHPCPSRRPAQAARQRSRRARAPTSGE